jgi:flagellar biosynthesis protein FlhA
MVVKPYLDAAGNLPAHFLDPNLEHSLESAVEHTENSSQLNVPPQKIREVAEKLGRTVASTETPVVLLAGSGSRYFLRQIAEPTLPNLMVLSHLEIPPGTRVVSLGLIQ